MKRLRKQFDMLITMYRTVRDADEILESDYYDMMAYDIDGYNESFYEAEFDKDMEYASEIISNLTKQVSAASSLLIAMKKLNFIYG